MKLQNIFVSYFLLPIISILLAIIVIFLNKENTRANTKKIILFIIGFSLAISIPSLFTFIGVSFIPLYYSIVQIFFLFVGFYYFQKIHSLFDTEKDLFSKSMILLITIIVLCMGSYFFSVVFNYFGDLKYGLIASTCTYPIIIPTFLNWTYKAQLKIPSEIFKIWKYNNNYTELFFLLRQLIK